MNAALLISEVQNEAKDRGEFLGLVTLDAAKAFGVVWQGSLLRKIYREGVDGSLWPLRKTLTRGLGLDRYVFGLARRGSTIGFHLLIA